MNIQAPISVGELIDKLTILEIKLAEIDDPAKRAHVRHEYETLLAATPPNLRAYAELQLLRERLKSVNTELWRIEDDIRNKERVHAFDEEFVRLARAVYVTNDRRAALKREINRLTGSDLVEEKSYASY